MSFHDERLIERVRSDPDFVELVRRRSRLAWLLTSAMIIIYFGFVLAIAYYRDLLAESLGGGVTTVGIPVGLGAIVSAFALTGVYVARANTVYDAITKKIIEKLDA